MGMVIFEKLDNVMKRTSKVQCVVNSIMNLMESQDKNRDRLKAMWEAQTPQMVVDHAKETLEKLLTKEELDVLADYGEGASIAEIAMAYQKTEKQIISYIKRAFRKVFPRVEHLMYGDVDSFPLNFLATCYFYRPEDTVEILSVYEREGGKCSFWYVFHTLTDKEQELVLARYRDNLTLEQVSETQDISRERVRQILMRVERKMRIPWRFDRIKKGLTAYYEGVLQEERKSGIDAGREQVFKQFQKELSEDIEKGDKDAVFEKIKALLTGDTSQYLKMSMAEFNEKHPFPTRAVNIFLTYQIDTVEELTQLTEEDLRNFRNCSTGTIDSIKNVLAEVGLSLAKEVET